MTTADLVVVSYVSPVDGLVKALLTTLDARRHWDCLPEPLKATYSVREATAEDRVASDYAFTSGVV